MYKRCEEQIIVLNDEKKVGKEIIFPGRKITENGIMSDEKKVEAVLNLPAPTNISDVKRLWCSSI